MRIAELARTRPLLGLGALGVIATLAIAWAQPDPTPRAARQPPRPWTGCGAAKHRPAPPPPAPAVAPVAHSENAYYDVLLTARDQLTKCMVQHDVEAKLVFDIGPEGRVTNVEVTARAKNLANVDLKVVKCLERAVSPLQFPASDKLVRISTNLAP